MKLGQNVKTRQTYFLEQSFRQIGPGIFFSGQTLKVRTTSSMLFSYYDENHNSCRPFLARSRCQHTSADIQVGRVLGKATINHRVFSFNYEKIKTFQLFNSRNSFTRICDSKDGIRIYIFLKQANPGLFQFIFVLFKQHFIAKTVHFSRIRTRIVGVEGKHADH